MNNYGCLIFDDVKKCCYIYGLLGELRKIDDNDFSDLCIKIILKKDISGCYRSGGLTFCLEVDDDGLPFISAMLDNRRILECEF